MKYETHLKRGNEYALIVDSDHANIVIKSGRLSISGVPTTNASGESTNEVLIVFYANRQGRPVIRKAVIIEDVSTEMLVDFIVNDLPVSYLERYMPGYKFKLLKERSKETFTVAPEEVSEGMYPDSEEQVISSQ